MSDAICFSVKSNCYALRWSYGEICVGANCCGQFGKGLKMWQARLEYHQSCLNEQLKFNNWIDGYVELQKKNQATNIKLERKDIQRCKRMIRYFK